VPSGRQSREAKIGPSTWGEGDLGGLGPVARHQFPVLSLEEVYGAITDYLAHHEAVPAYFATAGDVLGNVAGCGCCRLTILPWCEAAHGRRR
jgi:hypothetical protein